MFSTTLPTHPRTGLKAIGRRRNGEPIWPVMGGGPDPDPDKDDDGDGDADDADDGDGGADDSPPDGDDSDDDNDPDGADGLGDRGKKALDAMKAKVKTERQKRREAEEKLRKAAEKKPDDDQPSADDIRREADEAATQKANARIVRSEIRAAAAGKLADPKDALTFLDLDQFEVDENGEVDSDEVADAIDDLIKSKPYLAAQGGKRFQGTGDGGAARKASKPKQLTEADLKSMTPEQIVKAQDEGRLNDLLGVT